MPRPLVSVLVLVVVGALVGCGGSTGRAGPPSLAPTSTASAPQTVEIRNYSYTPQNITVSVGTTVIWVQDDSTIHTVTDAGVFDSGPLSRGQRYSHTFRTSGTYTYRCTVHPAMTGTVTVH